VIEGKTYTEAITLANREAIAAEHLLLHARPTDGDYPVDVIDYLEDLKEFILFVRYSVSKKRVSKDKYNHLFRSRPEEF
jgi:hypothetical protein